MIYVIDTISSREELVSLAKALNLNIDQSDNQLKQQMQYLE